MRKVNLNVSIQSRTGTEIMRKVCLQPPDQNPLNTWKCLHLCCRPLNVTWRKKGKKKKGYEAIKTSGCICTYTCVCVSCLTDGHRHLCSWLRFRVQLLPHLRRLQLKLLHSDLWLVGGRRNPTPPRQFVNTAKDSGKHVLERNIPQCTLTTTRV